MQNKQICSFSAGLWITNNKSETWSPDAFLPRWGVEQNEEEDKIKMILRGQQGKSLLDVFD